MPPEAASADFFVTGFLARIERRILVIDLVRSAAIGVLTAAITVLALRLLGVASGPALIPRYSHSKARRSSRTTGRETVSLAPGNADRMRSLCRRMASAPFTGPHRGTISSASGA